MSSAGLSYDAALRPTWDEALLSLARTALDDPDAFEVVGDAHLEALDRGYTYFAWQLVVAPWSSEPWAMPARCPDGWRFFLDGVEMTGLNVADMQMGPAQLAGEGRAVSVARADGFTYEALLTFRPTTSYGVTLSAADSARLNLVVQQTYDAPTLKAKVIRRRNNDGSGFNGTPRDLRVSKRRG